MTPIKTLSCLCGVALSLLTVPLVLADTFPVIVQGKVTLEDGSVPSFQVSIERVCSDGQGDTPGPLTNKKGEFLWRLEVDPFASRSCIFRASHTGYTSTTADASNINLSGHSAQVTLPPFVLVTSVADPYAIRVSDDNIPGKAKGPVSKAMKALDSHNVPEAAQDFQAAVAAAPKFGDGWHALGVIDEQLQKSMEAREAYEKSIEVDPKQFGSYIALERLCLKTKDWQCTIKAGQSYIKADNKKLYPEAYLHLAVAQYETKDLSGAETSAQEALRHFARHKKARTEYVLGRILEAKGDANGAREHMNKYLQMDPNASDLGEVKAHIDNLGKQVANGPDPALEPL